MYQAIVSIAKSTMLLGYALHNQQQPPCDMANFSPLPTALDAGKLREKDCWNNPSTRLSEQLQQCLDEELGQAGYKDLAGVAALPIHFLSEKENGFGLSWWQLELKEPELAKLWNSQGRVLSNQGKSFSKSICEGSSESNLGVHCQPTCPVSCLLLADKARQTFNSHRVARAKREADRARSVGARHLNRKVS
jgi:hypothetical protein